MYLENNLASKIQQSQHYTFERAVEGASPYNAEIMQILNTVERCSPLQLFGQVLPPQNRSALCVSTLRLGLEKRCRFNSPISLSSNI